MSEKEDKLIWYTVYNYLIKVINSKNKLLLAVVLKVACDDISLLINVVVHRSISAFSGNSLYGEQPYCNARFC